MEKVFYFIVATSSEYIGQHIPSKPIKVYTFTKAQSHKKIHKDTMPTKAWNKAMRMGLLQPSPKKQEHDMCLAIVPEAEAPWGVVVAECQPQKQTLNSWGNHKWIEMFSRRTAALKHKYPMAVNHA